MITFYYNAAPNPAKVALMLEEIGLPYEIVPVDSRNGEQHAPAYTALNPNAKVPAISHDNIGPSSCRRTRLRNVARCCHG